MKKRGLSRKLLFVVALLLSPLTCCGGTYLLDLLPAALVPPAVDFTLNLFENEVLVANRTGARLYLTPITTTTGEPLVIRQVPSLRQRDIPVRPGQAVVLTYDAADRPLDGIAVCKRGHACRRLDVDFADTYELASYEALPALDPAWRAAIQSTPTWSLGAALVVVLGLVPVILFAGWLYLGVRDSKEGGDRSATFVYPHD
jgi:hypothetical protein